MRDSSEASHASVRQVCFWCCRDNWDVPSKRDYVELATDFFFRFFSLSEQMVSALPHKALFMYSFLFHSTANWFVLLAAFSCCLTDRGVRHMTAVAVVKNKHFILLSFKNREQGKASGTFPILSPNLPWVWCDVAGTNLISQHWLSGQTNWLASSEFTERRARQQRGIDSGEVPKCVLAAPQRRSLLGLLM